VIGGTETYGKYIATPYPALIEAALGLPVVNFGYMNAGMDVFLGESAVMDTCAGARVAVVQLLGAQNISNRFYSVHPRRNDRFLRASPLMRTIFPEVDFAEFHFTRHMLLALRRRAPERYGVLEAELKAAWLSRVRQFLKKIPAPKILLQLGDHHADGSFRDELGAEPLLIDKGMLAALRPIASAIVHVDPTPEARQAGTDGMIFAPLDGPIASEMPGPAIHREIASALLPAMRRFL